MPPVSRRESMENRDTLSAPRELPQVFGRAVVAAHLISGNPEFAEQAVVRAVERWNPDEWSEDQFLGAVMHEVVGFETLPEPFAADYLPDELKAVLRLEPLLRSCFVLRNFAGLPSRVCARLLQLPPDEIDNCNISALRRLALL